MSTQIYHFQYKKKFTLNYPQNMQLWYFFQGTPEPVRSNHGKRAISVRATEFLLYY